jgi:hypothetical protein
MGFSETGGEKRKTLPHRRTEGFLGVEWRSEAVVGIVTTFPLPAPLERVLYMDATASPRFDFS